MTKLTNAKGRPFAWSYSRRSDFENCPAKYAASHFYCTIPYTESKEAAYGNRVHKAAEMFLKGKPHPDVEALLPVEKYCEKMIRTGCPIKAELQIALTRNLLPTSWFSGTAWCRMQIDVVLEKTKTVCSLFDWKGLALDTDILTTEGWKTMDTLQVGDKVFSRSGKPCRVVAKSPVFNKPCYRIKFRDGAEVVCDEDHLWVSSLSGAGYTQTQRQEVVLSAKDIHELSRGGVNISIPLPDPVQQKKLDIYENGIHPYLLGAWLGDGSSSKGEICKPNSKLFSYIESLGYKVGPDISSQDRVETHTIYGLANALRNSSLLSNKHIPTAYLLANYEDRVSLLRGLMDTDGYWNIARFQSVFSTVRPNLAFEVAELLSSLGQRPYVATTIRSGFGKKVLAYDVVFTPIGLNPFLNKPVAEEVERHIQTSKQDRKSIRRYILSIELIDSVPTQCISVDSEDNTYLCTKRYVVTHNTSKTVRHDEEQLRVNIAGLSQIYPQYEHYEGRYIWTKHDEITSIKPVSKSEVQFIWEDALARAYKMEEAWRLERFPAKPSALCQWCSVEGCKVRRGERKV